MWCNARQWWRRGVRVCTRTRTHTHTQLMLLKHSVARWMWSGFLSGCTRSDSWRYRAFNLDVQSKAVKIGSSVCRTPMMRSAPYRVVHSIGSILETHWYLATSSINRSCF